LVTRLFAVGADESFQAGLHAGIEVVVVECGDLQRGRTGPDAGAASAEEDDLVATVTPDVGAGGVEVGAAILIGAVRGALHGEGADLLPLAVVDEGGLPGAAAVDEDLAAVAVADQSKATMAETQLPSINWRRQTSRPSRS